MIQQRDKNGNIRGKSRFRLFVRACVGPFAIERTGVDLNIQLRVVVRLVINKLTQTHTPGHDNRSSGQWPSCV